MQEKLEQILMSYEREGSDKLAIFLATSDFYQAPCSTKNHLNCPGGLAQHTMNVINCASALCEQYNLPPENGIIAAICHDFCKINFYQLIHEDPSDAQQRYLTSLLAKAGLRVTLPAGQKMNKAYASVLIDFMLKQYKPGVTLPEYVFNYTIKDSLPIGHGEKSLFIAQQYIKLTLDEMLAIRWHMGMSDISVHSGTGVYAYKEAIKASKLVTILQLADMEASFLMEA